MPQLEPGGWLGVRIKRCGLQCHPRFRTHRFGTQLWRQGCGSRDLNCEGVGWDITSNEALCTVEETNTFHATRPIRTALLIVKFGRASYLRFANFNFNF